MATALQGHVVWSGSRDADGHRDYTVSHKVQATVEEGPHAVMFATGLPLIGAKWKFFKDEDEWAFCTPDRKITRIAQDDDRGEFWLVEDTFSTKPGKRCQDESIENPLLEPFGISGSFAKYTKEASHDWKGNRLLSSSHEPLKGPQLEFDESKMSVKISQNVPNLQLWLLANCMNMLNDRPLWGLPKRTVKVDGISFTRKTYGKCFFYYTRELDFDIDFNTHDKEVPDEGTKVLRGHWKYDKKRSDDEEIDESDTIENQVAQSNAWVLDRINGKIPDRRNPSHFDRFRDRNGELTKTALNGYGLPAEVFVIDPAGRNTTNVDDGTGEHIGTGFTPNETHGTGTGLIHRTKAAMIKIERYREGNLLLLSLPTSL